MSLISSDDQVITRRIILKEHNIRKLATKFLDLMTKFKSLTRNEMVPILSEILNEIELIEISVLKAENIQKMNCLPFWEQMTNKVLTANCNDTELNLFPQAEGKI